MHTLTLLMTSCVLGVELLVLKAGIGGTFVSDDLKSSGLGHRA